MMSFFYDKKLKIVNVIQDAKKIRQPSLEEDSEMKDKVSFAFGFQIEKLASYIFEEKEIQRELTEQIERSIVEIVFKHQKKKEIEKAVSEKERITMREYRMLMALKESIEKSGEEISENEKDDNYIGL